MLELDTDTTCKEMDERGTVHTQGQMERAPVQESAARAWRREAAGARSGRTAAVAARGTRVPYRQAVVAGTSGLGAPAAPVGAAPRRGG